MNSETTESKTPVQRLVMPLPPHLQLQMEKVFALSIRLEKAEQLLQRAYDGMHKEHWQEGESEAEVCESIAAFLSDRFSSGWKDQT